mmetsp:Transcript_28610/g.84676  ORF Transcript_28610/g.84676 Transcript_28610/m.84676 type:complete len:228 (+) Transcript_28610:1016-1699(+)
MPRTHRGCRRHAAAATCVHTARCGAAGRWARGQPHPSVRKPTASGRAGASLETRRLTQWTRRVARRLGVAQPRISIACGRPIPQCVLSRRAAPGVARRGVERCPAVGRSLLTGLDRKPSGRCGTTRTTLNLLARNALPRQSSAPAAPVDAPDMAVTFLKRVKLGSGAPSAAAGAELAFGVGVSCGKDQSWIDIDIAIGDRSALPCSAAAPPVRGKLPHQPRRGLWRA